MFTGGEASVNKVLIDGSQLCLAEPVQVCQQCSVTDNDHITSLVRLRLATSCVYMFTFSVKLDVLQAC